MTTNPPPPRHVLLTGAAGRIGTAFWRNTGDRYRFRLADRDIAPLTDATQAGHDVVTLDVADLDACRAACAGIDTVLHLAADPSPDADFYASLLANNIKGTYNVFQAAADQRCRRVVYASSIHAVVGYPSDVPIRPEWPVRPTNMYGVSKCFGEAVAACFAAAGLSSIAVRIGAFDAPWLRRRPAPEYLDAYLSHRDLNQLLVRCIDTPDIDFAIVFAISDNRQKRVDLTSTRDLLGYAPQDDGFRLLDVPDDGTPTT